MTNPSQRTWQNCLEEARQAANALDFEGAASCCLTYLHEHLGQADHSHLEATPEATSLYTLSVVFACAGNGERWANFLGKPKHWADLGEGTPLIQRTTTQFNRAFPSASHMALISPGDHSLYSQLYDLILTERQGPSQRFPGIEVLEQALAAKNNDRDVLWIYGDVFFSTAATQRIAKTIHANPAQPRFFGRKQKNELYGNGGGEIFAVYAPAPYQERLLAYYEFIQRLRLGTPLLRCTNWEVLSLAAALCTDEQDPLPTPSLINNSLGATFKAITSNFSARNFHPALWIEINDATEDFDYPFEYLERLFRRVAWTGQGIREQ